MAINDNFVLEISAQIKKDTTKIVKELEDTLKELEKKSTIDLEINEDKLSKYIEKLKASMNEINIAMNNASIEANCTAFRTFINLLEEGAMYSEDISKNLQSAASVMSNLNSLQEKSSNKNNTGKNKSSNSKNNNSGNDRKSELKQSNTNNLKKQLKVNQEIKKLHSSMANDFDKKSNSAELI